MSAKADPLAKYRHLKTGRMHYVLCDNDAEIVTVECNVMNDLATTHSWLGPARDFIEEFAFVNQK